LFYRANGTSCKLLVRSFRKDAWLFPAQREGVEWFCFSFHRKVFLGFGFGFGFGLVLTGSQVQMPRGDARRIFCRRSPQAESRSGSCGSYRRLGAPTARTAFEYVPMMEYAIQHRGHRGYITQ
jgi:hypothetical protein